MLGTQGAASACLCPHCEEHTRFIISVGWPKAKLSWIIRRKIQLILYHGLTWGSNEKNLLFMCFHLNLGFCKNALKIDVTLSPDHDWDFPYSTPCSVHCRKIEILCYKLQYLQLKKQISSLYRQQSLCGNDIDNSYLPEVYNECCINLDCYFLCPFNL